jgi:hypothetical protein
MPLSVAKSCQYIPVMLVFFLFFACKGFAGQQVTQTGVASAPDDSPQMNIEQLRQRAIRNAMDLAILQVTGAEISSERTGSVNTRDETIIQGEKAQGVTSQKSRFNTAVRSRVEGHARLVNINREWCQGAQYFVDATFDVDTPEEILQKKNAGYFWKNAGSPSLALVFKSEANGEPDDNQETVTMRFFRDSLVRNDLEVSTAPKQAHYLIKIHQMFDAKEMVDYGTMTVHCRLSFQIIDQLISKTLAEYRASHGPDAGFNLDQARESCLKAIAPDVSKQLIYELASIMNDRYINGIKQSVIISNVPGEYVPMVTEILNNLYRMSSTLSPSYQGGTYTQKVQYKGNGGELVMAIQDAFADHDWQVKVKRIDARSIYLAWSGTH